MSLAFIRIDDRLIHGQIVTTWMQHVGATAIVVANDAVAKDSFTAKMISMAAPSGIKVFCYSLDQTVDNMKNGSLDKYAVLILTKTVEDVYALKQKGLEFNYVNVGGMGSKPGSKVIHKNIAVTESQMELLKEMKSNGVDIEFKIVPTDKGLKL